ncbi:unnamed protein product [Amaranthus hypochondriacus]
MFSYILNFALFLSLSSSLVKSDKNYFIACGISNSNTHVPSDETQIWQSDDNSSFSPPNLNRISSAVIIDGDYAPYKGARIFNSPVTYSFKVSPGPKFLRLYFTTSTSYTINSTNMDPSKFFISLKANNLTLFNNFSAFLNSQNSKFLKYNTYEFCLTVQKNIPLNLTFSSPSSSTYGYVNGIEIVKAPSGLYQTQLPVYVSMDINYPLTESTFFQKVYRINVGGSDVDSRSDGLLREWKRDADYIINDFYGATALPYSMDEKSAIILYTPETPSYSAPKIVYDTVRTLGLIKDPSIRLKKNLTWRFEVDYGFDYLIRLHFCEKDEQVTKSLQRIFEVLFNDVVAEEVDVWYKSGGFAKALYRDYIVSNNLFGQSNGTKVPLVLALRPIPCVMTDVILNGIEILKINLSDGLAALNPPLITTPTSIPTTQNRTRTHHIGLIPIIVSITIVAILGSLFCAYVVYKRKAKNISSKNNKDDASRYVELRSSKTSINNSFLPSDLCRRFSFNEIRYAANDFDENLVIGVGGFGKVYKGSIDGRSITVAIKRLNPMSKQGVREFHTEIELLSRLRHAHLVSLIGYCDEEGEMILVYEYMQKGTLRDHLMYKNSIKNVENSTPLSWKSRLMICIGSARGLNYLHTGLRELIIHRDVKSTNILLDEDFTAKVSDFGISKIGLRHEEDNFNTHVTTIVKGSMGYLDPEYFYSQQLTEKSDVYSFGVVLFEILCARPPMDRTLSNEEVNLATWAKTHCKNKTIHTLVDPNLKGQIAPECFNKFVEIAELCVRDHGSERPPMGDVVWGLEFALELQETAEKNNGIMGDVVNEFVGPTSFNFRSGSYGGTVDNDVNSPSYSTSSDFDSKVLIDRTTTDSSDRF